MEDRYLIELNGKSYPLYAGVLNEAHERGITGIRTELVQIPDETNGNVAIVKATVMIDPKGDGHTRIFEGYGDASPRNVNSRIAAALIRMAETRAKGRALRDAVNIGETLAEELPDLGGPPAEERPARAPVEQPRKQMVVPPSGNDTHCAECGVELPDAVRTYSLHNFGRSLCRAHQPRKERAA